MPANALEAVNPDYVVKADELAPLLVQLVNEGAGKDVVDNNAIPREVPLETVEEASHPDEAQRSEQLGPPSGFTCPDCHGTLYEIDSGDHVRFRCRVGHAYSETAMMKAHNDSVERALWSALRVLEERSALIRKLATYARRRGHTGVAELYDQRMAEVELDVKALHELVTSSPSLEPVGQPD